MRSDSARKIVDPFGRVISYLRVSVTDRCNFRCNYCSPRQGYHPQGRHSEYLDYDEITFIVRCFAELGLRRVRLTGGEPLVRKHLSQLVAQLAQLDQLEDISLSTNAHRLARHADELAAAGLHRVNISLDTLNEEQFKRITRGGNLGAVLAGIAAAQEAGLAPIKINCVVMKGVNDAEIERLVDWSRDMSLELRFIELMPIGSTGIHAMNQHYPASAICKRLEKHLKQPLYPAESRNGGGPARYFRTIDGSHKFGVISAVSQHFCDSCNRVRLTSRGMLALCLGQMDSVDFRTPLRSGMDDDGMKQLIREAIRLKPERHFFRENIHNIEFREMVSLGG